MKWVLCGLTFALTVALAVATAAVRADNIRLRERLEQQYRRAEARWMELQRLSLLAVETATPERLAAELRTLLALPGGSGPGSGPTGTLVADPMLAGPVAEAAPWQ